MARAGIGARPGEVKGKAVGVGPPPQKKTVSPYRTQIILYSQSRCLIYMSVEYIGDNTND